MLSYSFFDIDTHLVLNFIRLILVDSTRAGKRIPDALSKTVPIWCAVVNRAIRIRHPHQQQHEGSGLHLKPQTMKRWNSALYTPPGVISAQEHRQIEERLDKWAEDLAVGSVSANSFFMST